MLFDLRRSNDCVHFSGDEVYIVAKHVGEQILRGPHHPQSHGERRYGSTQFTGKCQQESSYESNPPNNPIDIREA